jgi:hypothetical protein
MKLFVNDKEVSIDEIKKCDQYGWVKVYVNGYASAHSLPVESVTRNCTFFTSGNKYKVVID